MVLSIGEILVDIFADGASALELDSHAVKMFHALMTLRIVAISFGMSQDGMIPLHAQVEEQIVESQQFLVKRVLHEDIVSWHGNLVACGILLIPELVDDIIKNCKQ